jgi:hypothetical protein
MAQPTLSIRTLLAVPARAVIRAGLACVARWIDLPAHPHESAGERAVVISDGCHLPAKRPDLRSTGDTTGVLSNHSTRSFSSDSGRQQERWISQEGPRPPANRCKSCHVEGAARRRPKRPWRQFSSSISSISGAIASSCVLDTHAHEIMRFACAAASPEEPRHGGRRALQLPCSWDPGEARNYSFAEFRSRKIHSRKYESSSVRESSFRVAGSYKWKARHLLLAIL